MEIKIKKVHTFLDLAIATVVFMAGIGVFFLQPQRVTISIWRSITMPGSHWPMHGYTMWRRTALNLRPG